MNSAKTGDAADMDRRSFAFGVAAIMLVAASFRFWDLDAAALWMDEAFTIMAGRLPVQVILFDEIDVHPPLAYVLQHYWMRLAPDLALARVPAAALGTATVLVIIGWVADLWSRKAALWAGMILAVSTGHIWYSQDARMYPLVLLCLALSQWGLSGTLARGQDRIFNGYVVLYVVAALAAVHTHVIALIFLATTNFGGLVLLLGDRRFSQMFRQFLPMNGLVLALSLPWIAQVLDTTSSFHGLGAETTPAVIAFFIRNAIGYAGLPRALDLAILGFLALASVGGGIRAARSAPALAHVGLAGLVLFPLTLIALHMVTPILAARMFLPLLLPVCCLTGVFLASLRPAALGWAGGGALVGVAVWASTFEHFGRTKHDDPRAALSAAHDAGYEGAPVVTCHFLDAGAVQIAAEQLGRPLPTIFTHNSGEVFRYDWDFFQSVRLSMAQLRRASAEDVNTFLGGGHLIAKGIPQALADYEQVVFLFNSCESEQIDEIVSRIGSAGYALRRHERFQRAGRVLMESGNSEILLFSK